MFEPAFAQAPWLGHRDEKVLARRSKAIFPVREVTLGKVDPRYVLDFSETCFTSQLQDLGGSEETDERRPAASRPLKSCLQPRAALGIHEIEGQDERHGESRSRRERRDLA